MSELSHHLGSDGTIDAGLRAALGRIARVPQLLVGCDYDGTLAPLVDDPTTAHPLPEAVAAVPPEVADSPKLVVCPKNICNRGIVANRIFRFRFAENVSRCSKIKRGNRRTS